MNLGTVPLAATSCDAALIDVSQSSADESRDTTVNVIATNSQAWTSALCYNSMTGAVPGGQGHSGFSGGGDNDPAIVFSTAYTPQVIVETNMGAGSTVGFAATAPVNGNLQVIAQ